MDWRRGEDCTEVMMKDIGKILITNYIHKKEGKLQ